MLLQSITSSFTKIGSCQVAICNSAYAVTATASANGVGGRPPHCRLRARPRFVAVFAGRGPTTYPWYGISGWQSLCGCLPPQPAFSGTRRTRRHCPVADVFSTAAAVIYTFNQPLLAGAHGAYAVPAPATAHGVHAIPAAAAVPPPPPAASASPPPSPKPSLRRGTPRKRRPCRLGDDVYAVPVAAVAACNLSVASAVDYAFSLLPQGRVTWRKRHPCRRRRTRCSRRPCGRRRRP